MEAAQKYIREDGSDNDRHDNVKTRAEAGRKCVRSIHHHPILSPGWLTLADSLEQLSRLAQIEASVPANQKVSDSKGRNEDSAGTLWDQEQSENAIRILVEEAKVNLCLRMMNDYKKWAYNPAERKMSLQQSEYSESQLNRKCVQFEEALGFLLSRSFMHVETLQLTDIPLLIEHCAMVFNACRQQGAATCSGIKSQETVVINYFSYLMKHAEQLNNSELLAKVKELNLIHLATDHILARAEDLPWEIISTAADGLSALADNEDFQTNWESFFVDAAGHPDAELKRTFAQLEERVANLVLKENPDRKKSIRPLLDFFNTLRRSTR
eukprot:gnl/TRDRNA2_/TRDRNA2_179598_c0_seq1.p1 gnl/TRDRNA2_/TRDRNA2_179598_c0~~gnl/TRDRNA2_/TRDRNA2_179598_c0_seq1.p1  ORF type:complete len:325 (+),score=77.29 gnl/TRDRNA2_/TRDRNA2_179598_c0_seq1:83-1057(+)